LSVKTGTTAYPAGLDTFDSTIETTETLAAAGQDHPQIHANLAAAINAVQAELGVNPSQAEATVAALLAKMADKTIATTKGDLLAATAASTLARVGVGTDGQVLTADSGETAGVKWGAGIAAGVWVEAALTLGGWAVPPSMGKCRYLALGVHAYLYTFSASGTSNSTGSNLTLPWTATGYPYGTVMGIDNGGTREIVFAEASGTTLSFLRAGGVAWTASGSKQVRGQIIIEV
jgi:hypothetical protein